MSRPLKIEVPGASCPVNARGNRGKTIYEDDGNRRLFLAVLGNVAENFDWRCPATGADGHQRIAEAFGVHFTNIARSVRAERKAPKDAMQHYRYLLFPTYCV